jgi:hypothetical protein
MKTKFVILISVLLSIAFISCRSSKKDSIDPEELARKYPYAKICVETEKTIKLAKKKGYKALTVKDIKKMLLNDTTHYKIVIFYSPCCGASEEHMARTYPKILKRVGKEKVKWYYVLDNTGGIVYNEDLRKNYGIDNFEKYYLHDSKFPLDNAGFANIANYIFDKDDIKINDELGLPTNFIVSKDGKLLKSLFVYNDVKAIHTTDLYSILDKDLEDLDFNKIDTVRIPYSKHETMQEME